MKKLTLLLIALIGVLTMNAKVVTEQEALQKAQRFMQGKRFMQGRRLNQSQTQARRVAQKNVPAYYIFNVEHEDGFVIVSGDDRTAEILGYSEHGNLNPDNAPDNVKWWLSEYEQQIEWLLNSADEGAIRRATETSHRDGWTAIEPLVKSQWNQYSPYNDLCPTVDGERTPTGCVATTMAQIMNYHQWPVTGTGSNSYDWNGQTLSMDFSEITFDWENMQNIYSDDDSSEAKNAVATLMSACGISFNTDYKIGESGALSGDAAKALHRNFDYTADYVFRKDYELSDWESMIYTDLGNKRPVYYAGISSTGGAHAFVCDGYSNDGLFHINWGWGGSWDGYFLLSVLDPPGEESGFINNQEIIYGIRPVQQALIDGIHYYLSIEDGQATVIPSDEGYYIGNIVIPSTVTYNGKVYNVTSIGRGAFFGCSSLTSVIISEGVTSIEHSAFDDCSALTSVTIPESVTSIGNYAFNQCSSLTSITIPTSVTSIGNFAFFSCSSLTSVTIPKGVTSIGYSAFNDCSSLTSVIISEDVTSIGNSAFFGCSSLTSVTISEGVTSIGHSAFYDCSNLTSVAIPASVTSIGDFLFTGCSSLTSVTVDEGNPVYDSRDNCNAIIETASNTLIMGCQNTIIPESVTSIGNSAFYDCIGLTSVNISEGVTSIGAYAFTGCSSLTSIAIPESVTSIGNEAFAWCESLTSVYSWIEDPFRIDNKDIFDGIDHNATLYVPKGTTSVYTLRGWTAYFSHVVEFNATSIAETPAGRADGDVIYNLNGVRTDNTTKGLYVKHSKKVMVK